MNCGGVLYLLVRLQGLYLMIVVLSLSILFFLSTLSLFLMSFLMCNQCVEDEKALLMAKELEAIRMEVEDLMAWKGHVFLSQYHLNNFKKWLNTINMAMEE